MLPEKSDTLSMTMNDLRKLGYTADYNINDNGELEGPGRKKIDPKNIKIIGHYRFEGMTNPADMSVLYVVETDSGHRGLLVEAFGTYADTMDANLIKQLKEARQYN